MSHEEKMKMLSQRTDDAIFHMQNSMKINAMLRAKLMRIKIDKLKKPTAWRHLTYCLRTGVGDYCIQSN